MAKSDTFIDSQSWALLALLSILWGGSFLFAGIAVRDLPPLVIVMARVVIAAAAIMPLHLALQGSLPRSLRTWGDFAAMSMLNNVIPFTLIVTGQTMIASGLASVINATTPLFTVLILAALREEALVWRKIAGLLIGLAGVAVIRGLDLASGDAQSVGILLCLGAAVSYGFAGLWAKRRLKGIAPLTSATCQLACSSLIMVPLALLFSTPAAIAAASTQSWWAILGLAVLSTAIAYIVFFRIVERAGPAVVMLVTMLIPVSAILMGHVVLDEVLSARELFGAIIIGAALLVIDGRIMAWRGRRRSSAG